MFWEDSQIIDENMLVLKVFDYLFDFILDIQSLYKFE